MRMCERKDRSDIVSADHEERHAHVLFLESVLFLCSMEVAVVTISAALSLIQRDGRE